MNQVNIQRWKTRHCQQPPAPRSGPGGKVGKHFELLRTDCIAHNNQDFRQPTQRPASLCDSREGLQPVCLVSPGSADRHAYTWRPWSRIHHQRRRRRTIASVQPQSDVHTKNLYVNKGIPQVHLKRMKSVALSTKSVQSWLDRLTEKLAK